MLRTRNKIIYLAAVTLFATVSAFAQVASNSVSALRLPEDAATSFPASKNAGNTEFLLGNIYRVGPGDRFSVSINGVANSTRECVVDDNGQVKFEFADVPVSVGGMDASEIAAVLSKFIVFLKSPHLTVAVTDYQSHNATVTGSVLKPGRFVLMREAVPFYVVRADARPARTVSRVMITDADGTSREFPINSADADKIWITPGSIVDFRE